MKRRVCPAALVGCVMLLVLVPAGAFAGKVPESAYSRSMSIRPEFLDYTTLVFQHPQRAPLGGSRLFATSAGGTSPLGVGIIGERRGNALFFFMQECPSYLPGGDDLFQAGWGVSRVPVRFGAALRGSYRRYDEDEYYGGATPGGNFEERVQSAMKKSLEGCAGFGIQSGLVDLDVSVDYGAGDVFVDFLRRTERKGDTLVVHAEEEGDPFWGVGGRLVFHLAGHVDVITSGAYAGPDREIGVAVFEDSLEIDEIRSRSEFWHCGLAVAFPTDHVDRVALSALLQVEDGLEVREIYGGVRLQSTYVEKYWLAASFEHELRSDLLVRGGLEARYEQNRSEPRTITGHDFRYGQETVTRESIGYGFSWGAGYTWRMFELNGSVRTDLDLFQLFAAVDVRIRL